MFKLILGCLLALVASSAALAQSTPGLKYGDIPTAAQWNSFFAAKQDALGFAPLNSGGGSMSGPLITTPSSTGAAGINLPQGVAPTSPNDGDFWSTSVGFFGRVNGSTVGPFGTASSIAEIDTGAGLTGGPCSTGICTISLTSPVTVLHGGTGCTSLVCLSSAMGLGTMSAQSAAAVAITGGSVTGLPSPTASSDAATKSYVDATAAGLTPVTASDLATTAALAANTYANGTAGVGATLTANSNGALTVDGVAVTASQVIIVKNESTAANNGIYVVTQAGGVSTPYILTRVTYFDQAAEMVKNTYSNVTAGATLAGTSWILSAAVATVGTDPVTFVLFNSNPLSSLPSGQIFVGNGSGSAQARAMSGDAALSNTGAITVSKTGGVAFAASATTDTTSAANITSGTLPAARLPNPSASTLGGVQSFSSVSHQWLSAISTSGVPTASQPAFSDVSGSAGATQGGTGQTSYSTGDTIYASAANTLSKLPAGTSGQLYTMQGGGVPGWSTLANVPYSALASGAISSSSNYQSNTASVLLTPNAVWGAAGLTALTDTSTVAVDMATGVNFSLTLALSTQQLGAPTNVKAGQSGVIRAQEDATGNRALTYNAAYKFAGGTACAVSLAASTITYLFYWALSSSEILLSCVANVS